MRSVQKTKAKHLGLRIKNIRSFCYFCENEVLCPLLSLEWILTWKVIFGRMCTIAWLI